MGSPAEDFPFHACAFQDRVVPLAGAALLCGAVSALAQTGLHALPVPQGDPLAIDPAQDPVLALGEAAGAEDAFRQALAEAVARNPALAEAQAAGEEARAARSEARTARLPTVTLGLSSYRTLSRSFDNDPNYVIERLRAPQRTDTTVSLDQPLFDGGASNRASARPVTGCARRRPAWTARRRISPCAPSRHGMMSMPGGRWCSSIWAMPRKSA
jgi:hypothetical protein